MDKALNDGFSFHDGFSFLQYGETIAMKHFDEIKIELDLWNYFSCRVGQQLLDLL